MDVRYRRIGVLGQVKAYSRWAMDGQSSYSTQAKARGYRAFGHGSKPDVEVAGEDLLTHGSCS